MADETPYHPAFEAEDKTSGLHFVYVLCLSGSGIPTNNFITVWLNSPPTDRKLRNTFGPDWFPYHCESALSCYNLLYKQVVYGEFNMRLMGYVDPHTFEPLTEAHKNEKV